MIAKLKLYVQLISNDLSHLAFVLAVVILGQQRMQDTTASRFGEIDLATGSLKQRFDSEINIDILYITVLYTINHLIHTKSALA